MKQQKMTLRYSYAAPLGGEDTNSLCNDCAWEKYSLPLGNGFFGANVFGRTVTERIQISEPSLANPYYTPKTVARKACSAAGVNSFAEIFIDLDHQNLSDYERSLSLDDATAYVSYTHSGIRYTREYFTSHPDKVFAARLSADKKSSISFKLRAKVPFAGDYTVEPGDGLSKTAKVVFKENTASFEGELGYYGVKYFGALKVIAKGGCILTLSDGIKIENADEVILLFACDTNYKLSAQVFSEPEPSKKLLGCELDKVAVLDTLENAAALPFELLKERHLTDYRSLYSRVTLTVSGDTEAGYTDELIAAHKTGKQSSYLETLLFQYGRYLLISSSRTRLPAHLQGIWNAYSDSPWSCGYWHNINVQMNYWPSGPANLSDTFVPYINYAKAYMPVARQNADRYVQAKYPDAYSGEAKNGWIIGTGGWPYRISGFSGGDHSGPGTGAFTSLLFWDYYDYTRDEEFLREFGYPALYEMSLFFAKALEKIDGRYLIKESASPENVHQGKHYHTVGCAFDQQMVYENFKRTVQAAKILGITDDLIDRIDQMLPYLDPVLIGDDGQIKEYREETTYSSIGEPNHRHISHLVGLYPATVINADTPEWIEGAKVTLTKRGDRSTCWAVAHRLLLWARTKTPNKCRDLINSFIERNVLDNLWCYHPPFQIDGNFGYTAGVCEMLMQSHSGYIELLPALPSEWQSGEFTGLVARGNFVIDCRWEHGRIAKVGIKAKANGVLKIKLPAHLIPNGATLENGLYTKTVATGDAITFE